MQYQPIAMEAIEKMLSSRIQPFFRQGILRFDENLTPQNKARNNANGISNIKILQRCPSLQKLMINSTIHEISTFKKRAKNCTYYINDIFPFRVEETENYHISQGLRESLFSDKKYYPLSHYIPIHIDINAQKLVAAYVAVMVWLPKNECQKIESKYLHQYPDNAVLKLAVSGPAELVGGNYREGEIKYILHIHAENHSIVSVE